MLNVRHITSPAPVEAFQQVGSTNDLARDLARQGAVHLTAVLAEEQTHGRGRLGRVWHTFPAVSIALSVVVRNGLVETLPLVISLVVQRAIRKETGLPARIKWPNDVTLGGRKVAGILVEKYGLSAEAIAAAKANGVALGANAAETAGETFCIVGIGINVNNPDPPSQVDELPNGTTLQREAGGKLFSREKLVSRILDELQQAVTLIEEQGWPALAGAYAELCETLDQPVSWRGINGVARGLTADGGLILQTAQGRRVVRSGEIIAQGQGDGPQLDTGNSQ